MDQPGRGRKGGSLGQDAAEPDVSGAAREPADRRPRKTRPVPDVPDPSGQPQPRIGVSGPIPDTSGRIGRAPRSVQAEQGPMRVGLDRGPTPLGPEPLPPTA